MNTDIRLSVEFLDHPKTVKLQRRLGLESVFCLLRLWTWAAQNRSEGILHNMDAESIEIAARWAGEPDTFLDTLISLAFVDEKDGVCCLHNWDIHQEYVASEQARVDKARKAAQARWGKGQALPEEEKSIAKDNSELCPDDATSNATSMPHASPSNAPNRTYPEENTRVCLNTHAQLANSVPEIIPPNEPDNEPEPPSPRQPDIGFDQFFDAYPVAHRGGEIEAGKAWVALKGHGALPGLPRVLDALAVWEASPDWKEQGGRYVPSAAKFLEREYWNRRPRSPDDLPEHGQERQQRQPRATTVAQKNSQDRDMMAKMLLAKKEAQNGRGHELLAGNLGESCAALPACGQNPG